MAKVAKAKKEGGKIRQNVLPIVNPHAAGIDIGDDIHAVAVPPDSCEEPVRTFGSMTCDLHSIADWLTECGVNTVAMESTGVYWKSLASHLLARGIDVKLVNARMVKNVSGRKTDESDTAWIQKLHSCGLLSGAYLPGDVQDALRTLVRFRKTLVRESCSHILRMQKSLELMNIKVHTVISDILGVTGTAIVEAILAGEREASNFLPLVNSRIKADRETIKKSLEGNWRKEHLFTLQQSYELYKHYQQHIAATDKEIEAQLCIYEASLNEGIIEATGVEQEPKQKGRKSQKKKNKNNPNFETKGYLKRILGVDVLAIYGFSETSALQLFAETALI